MTTIDPTQGELIRELFRDTEGDVEIIAPFIKVGALSSLLEVIPPTANVRCVTRWLPREVSAGVSDPEIINVLEQRGNYTLSLVDNLHAKIYVAGEKCLAGSANVTLSGLGEANDENNIEVLVEAAIDNPGVASTLAVISRLERPANKTLAEAARRLANRLPATGNINDVEEHWFPRSRTPDRAFRLYSQPPQGFVGMADEILLQDLARSNIPPGLPEPNLRTEICTLLSDIPLAGALLNAAEDTRLTRLDAMSHLELLADNEYTTHDLWISFVNWMVYFFPMDVMIQEITEVALRRARLLR